jgi:hypothetical protein
MALTATYTNPSVSPGPHVTVAVSSAPARATAVLLERSTDGIRFTAVRGATALPIVSGAASVDDYEFADGVSNTYRATYLDATSPNAVGAWQAASVTTSAGASASVTPTMPTGLAVGDAVFVQIANTKVTASPPIAPAGWVLLALANGMAVYGADWSASLTIPAFTVTGLASGDKVIGKVIAMRNVASVLGNAQGSANVAGTTIAWPAFSAIAGSASAGFIMGFSRTINTGVAPAVNSNDTATGYTLIDWVVVAASYGSGAFTLSGATSATSAVLQINLGLRANVSQETGTVTPALTACWIKDPLAPYLNRPVLTTGIADITNSSRSGVFDVIARTLPIAVTDLYGGRKSTLTVWTADPDSMSDLHDCQMNGATKFIHAPKGSRAAELTGYYSFGDLDKQYIADTGRSRRLVLPLTEVAAPSATLAAVTGTWNSVVTQYATWNALVAAKPTWNDVLAIVGTPTDVITG